MSFLLNGDKMRERLAQILAQAQEDEVNQDKQHESRRERNVSRTGVIE